MPVNEASQYLLTLGKRNAQVYASLPGTRAIIITGSASEEASNFYSDLDMIVYHDTLPSEEALLAACQQNQGEGRRLYGERGEEECMEVYMVHGIECQVAHTTIAAWFDCCDQAAVVLNTHRWIVIGCHTRLFTGLYLFRFRQVFHT